MENKGIFGTTFIQIILLILGIGMILLIWGTLEGQYWIITAEFEKMANLRMAANLGYVVAGSSDALTFSDGAFTYSRILDSDKLDEISAIPSKYYYPGYSYKISVKDLETGKWWEVNYGRVPEVSSQLPSSGQGTIPQVVHVSIPVDIVYPTVSASTPGLFLQ